MSVIPTKEGDRVGRVGNVAGDEQKEDGDGNEDRHAERHLLAAVGRQQEDRRQQQGWQHVHDAAAGRPSAGRRTAGGTER